MNEKTIERVAGSLEVIAAFAASNNDASKAIEMLCIACIRRLRKLVPADANQYDVQLFDKWFKSTRLAELVEDRNVLGVLDLSTLTHHEYICDCAWLEDCDANDRRLVRDVVDKWMKAVPSA